MTKERFKLIAVVYVILRKDDQILLSRRANSGYQDGSYGLVAGHVDGDELATTAIAREAKEETGITLDPHALRFVHIAHRLSRNQVGQERIDLFYEANSWQGDPTNMEPGKCDDLSWFDVDHLPKNTIPFIRLVLEDIAKNVKYSEYETEPGI